VIITALTPDDWPSVRAIYAEGIATGVATFETRVPLWEEWDAARRPDCRLVVRGDDDRVLGWAALSPVSTREVYRGVAEVSVYVASEARRQGVGLALLNALALTSEAAGYWTLQATIFEQNEVSIELHRRAGFRVVGIRERVAQREGVWHNNVLMERRSTVVGT
jgi:L-amino acid N-acyltransferase YncA